VSINGKVQSASWNIFHGVGGIGQGIDSISSPMKIFVSVGCIEMHICSIIIECKIYMNVYLQRPLSIMIIQIEIRLASCMNFSWYIIKYYQYTEDSWKSFCKQGDSGGKINSFGGGKIDHCEKNIYMFIWTWVMWVTWMFTEIELLETDKTDRTDRTVGNWYNW
jgi:hypothetical protein